VDSGRLIALSLLAAVAAVCGGAVQRTASAATAGAGPGVVFSVFENLPPNGACPGLYAVDQATRRLTYLMGWDAQREDTAVYPAFTAGGTVSFGHWVDTTASIPAVDVYAGTRRVARVHAFTGWAWSPRREELAFARLTGREVNLVLGTVAGAQRVLARGAGIGLSWLPDGSGIVYGSGLAADDRIAFVRRDGRGRRELARNAIFPLVSPDGARVVFARQRAAGVGITRLELWVTALRGGRARKLLGPAAREELKPVLWLSNRELLVQHGGENDSNFDVGDRVTRLDVVTGGERPFLRRAFALSRSPDGRRVLFVRPHRGEETYYSIRTVSTSGRDEQLLAVTDEEDMNIQSLPVWKPPSVRIGPIGDPLPAGVNPAECIRRLAAVRSRTP
jgi:hypothetical protein